MTETDAALIDRMIQEIRTLDEPFTVAFRPQTLLGLVGALQLAVRHPGVAQATATHQTAHQVVEAAREYFAACPTVLEIIRRGDDPAFDRPLGATGRFPYGHLDDDDEGEITFALAADRQHGVVRVEFGTPVASLGLPVRQARALSEELARKAIEVERGKAWRRHLMNREHTFTMDLTPAGIRSSVFLDGDDISGLLRGVTVRSSVGTATVVELDCAYGRHVELIARLPEAQIVIVRRDDDDRSPNRVGKV